MTDIPNEFWKMLSADESLAALVKTRIHRNTVPKSGETPYLWYKQSGTLDDGCLDNEQGADPLMTSIDVECVGSDLDEALAVANCVKAKHHMRGAMGDVSILRLFVEDAADDYVPKNDFSDEGRPVVSLRVEVYR